MLAPLKRFLAEKLLDPEDRERLDRAPVKLNSVGYDEWGLDPQVVRAGVAAFKWFYKQYFRVETVGIEKIPTGRVLIIANHGGLLPVDGLLIAMSLLLEANPPRIARGMVERFFPALPYISSFLMRCGQMVGDIHNCADLLNKDECVLVFPEGVRGSGKPYFKRYQLQRFGTGFVRLALQTKTPIVPVAVIGCEEAYPGIAQLKPLARLLKIPYIPVTPFFPLLGPLGMIPLPTKVTLRYADPIYFEGDPDAPDAVIQGMVAQVQKAMQAELEIGLRMRGGKIFTGVAK